MKRRCLWAVCAALALAISGCMTWQLAPSPAAPPLAALEMPPPAPREFRGAWVASVANIDWPSRAGLPVAQQQAEMRALLDRARDIGLNAIVLQVRPSADALYASTLEPWSEYLNGEQGKAPAPYYDPLALWVQEAHRRGIELHAWFNPYRARHPSAKTPAAPPHVSLTRPGLVRSYGDLQWLDPGEASAAAHTLAVVADVVKRYDIDGVHIDDYFYPYPLALPSNGGDQPFPDDPPWHRYRDGGGLLSRDDWRRDNVNRLVQAMHETVHFVKPHLRFGISPFGLPRPDLRPEGIEGFSQYDKLYADVERWVERGWFDYLAPQLYWAIDRKPQAFAVLLDVWAAQTAAQGGARHLWPGLYTSSVGGAPGSARAWAADEIVNQIGLVRPRAAARGHIHFSMIALMQDRAGIATALKAGPYREAALAPASPWLDAERPPPPALDRPWGGGLQLRALSGTPPFLWAVWRRQGGKDGKDGPWRFAVQPATERDIDVAGCAAVVVSAVSRTGQESQRIALRLP